MRGSLSAGMPEPVSRTVRSTVPAAASGATRIRIRPPLGMAWRALVSRFKQHLLNLIAADKGRRRGFGSELDLHAILAHLALQQHERFLDELGDVGRRAVGAAIAGEAEHAVGDLLGTLRGCRGFS